MRIVTVVKRGRVLGRAVHAACIDSERFAAVVSQWYDEDKWVQGSIRRVEELLTKGIDWRSRELGDTVGFLDLYVEDGLVFVEVEGVNRLLTRKTDGSNRLKTVSVDVLLVREPSQFKPDDGREITRVFVDSDDPNKNYGEALRKAGFEYFAWSESDI